MATDQTSIPLTTPGTNYIFLSNPPVGPQPFHMICPHCRSNIITDIEHKATARTHSLCIVLSVIGCFLCAPFIYCNKSCMSKEHFCPICNKYVGTYEG